MLSLWRWFLGIATTTAVIAGTTATENSIPCSEISRALPFPCRCSQGQVEAALDGNKAISVDCDRVVFPGDFPTLPYGAPIVSFRQRWAGYQTLPTQVFVSSSLSLRSVDFSGNSLRRLTEKLLQGLQSSLVELRLADNLLGDTLNPIFSSSEFHGLRHLQLIDLSGNGIKAIEEGMFKGCDDLQELYLDRNSFYAIPGASLNGPKNLRLLSLKDNRIGIVKSGAFQAQPNLESIDLSQNLISNVEGGGFRQMAGLKTLQLQNNRLTKFNSDVFQGAENVEWLDLSENFIGEFPAVALKTFSDLRYLNLSSNLIRSLSNDALASFVNLYHLDLGRNSITNIEPGTFLGMKQLRKLDISVNSLRTIEDDAFEGLDNLETLSLKDNNILLIPASALGRLPHLMALHLDYNRVTALSGDILRSIAERLTTLVIARNVVRELPPATFQYFQQLQHLELNENLLVNITSDTFQGLENTLISLKLSQNRIATITGQSLPLRKLKFLDLSDNHLTAIFRNTFAMLTELTHLNLSRNPHLSVIPVDLFHTLPQLEVLDLSHVHLKVLPTDFFSKSSGMKELYLSNNDLKEISDGSFVNLMHLTVVDLSRCKIENVKSGSFAHVKNLKKLLLNGNELIEFKGEFFNYGTDLEILDISDNQLSHLSSSSFKIHARLKELHAAHNNIKFFPADLVAELQFLEYIDLSGNLLTSIDELDFARLPRLRSLLLSNNQIETISEMAFHNSTQLQIVDLARNQLDRLGERTFEGLVRLERLNLESNRLADLPETIFDRARLQILENINLARNLFEVAPLKSLQRQFFFVSSVDLSHNKIKDMLHDDGILVNIKNLDLSFNPLSREAVVTVLSEPKTVRELNLAGTGIVNVESLETPFLQLLNLSYNNITELSPKVFERATLLEDLDVSHNRLLDLSTFPRIWKVLKNLQKLNISVNPIQMISHNDFGGLDSLRTFSMHDLEECTRIEKTAFTFVPNLSHLDAYNYPKLGYLDIQGLLQHLPTLERINVETKDAAIGSDQLSSVLHPRLKELGIRGSRLRSISSGTLSGLKGNLVIRIRNTSVSSLPPALFFPVPRSSQIVLDVTGSQLMTLSSSLLVTLDDRRGDFSIVGLETNPIVCNCSARALRRWLPGRNLMIRCLGPPHLKNKLLIEIGDDELTCDPHKLTTTPPTATTGLKSTRLAPKTTEPDIIWSMAPTEKNRNTKSPIAVQSPINNDDTLIIGIVGGVVAFIAILVIIICIVRLKMTGSQYRGGPLANGTQVIGPGVVGSGSSCACSVKGAPPLYAVPPNYTAGYSATLPHKIQMSGTPSARATYSTMGRMPYQNSGQPYFIAYPSDEKIYR